MVPLPDMCFPVSLNISVSDDPVAARREQDTLFGEFSKDHADVGAICSFERGVGCIFFTYDATPSVIAHECFHMTLRVCEYIGSKLSSDSEEMYAYILEFLVRESTLLMEQANAGRSL